MAIGLPLPIMPLNHQPESDANAIPPHIPKCAQPPRRQAKLLDLPSETMAEIVNTIVNDDCARNVSATCRALRYPGQRRLFETVRLYFRYQVANLLVVLGNNTTLLTFIRQLHVEDLKVVLGQDLYTLKHRKDAQAFTDRENAFGELILIDLLKKPFNLVTFVVGWWPNNPMPWWGLPAVVQSSLFKFIRDQAESLRVLKLHSLCAVPTGLLYSCRNIQYLQLTFDESQENPHSSESSGEYGLITNPTSPTYFDLHYSGRYRIDNNTLSPSCLLQKLDLVRRRLDLSQLKSLDVTLCGVMFHDLSDILSLSSSTLRHLSLRINDRGSLDGCKTFVLASSSFLTPTVPG